MLTVLLFVQLSAAPLMPPQKPMKFPEKQPAMFARNVEIIEEARRREKGKVLTFTLLPHSAVVALAHECLIEGSVAAASVASAQHKHFLKKGKANTGQAKYQRRGKRNW